MADIVEVQSYRDGGTVLFRAVGSTVDGHYRLQTPLRGVPQPLFRGDVRLEVGSTDEAELLVVLREWLSRMEAVEAKGPPDESEGIPVRIEWLWRMAWIPAIQYVIETLEKRQPVT